MISCYMMYQSYKTQETFNLVVLACFQVEVVCVDDLCDPEVVHSKLRRAAEAGRWFVFNCRLSAPLGQLISSMRGQRSTTSQVQAPA